MTVGEAAVKAVKLFGSVWRRKVILQAGTNVTITETVSDDESTLTISSSGGGGGGGGAPTGAEYVTLATNGSLTNERVLTPGHGLDLADGGAGSTVTLDVDETELDHVALGLAIGSDVQAWSATLDTVTAGTYTGSTSITTLGTVATGTWSATAIGPTKGGTGLTSYAEGDILYASATNTLAKLAAPASGARDGKTLGWSGNTLAWVAPLLVTVIGGRDYVVEARAVYDVPSCTTVERP